MSNSITILQVGPNKLQADSRSQITDHFPVGRFYLVKVSELDLQSCDESHIRY